MRDGVVRCNAIWSRTPTSDPTENVRYVEGSRYDRAVAALKEAALWLSAEPLQTVRAAIEEADDED